jgi:integrase
VEARPPEPHTFDELCDYQLEHRTAVKRSQKDDKSMIEAHLRPAFGGLQLTAITIQRVDQYRRGRRHLSDKTLHNHLTLLISMLNLAIDLGWLAAAPRIKKPKLVEEEYNWLKSTEQIAALLAAAKEEAPGVMELYAAAVYTGMRAGELLGLTWGAVNLDSRLITVRCSYDKPTKTAAIRHLPILDPLLPVLREWRVRCWSSEWVFPSARGTMLQPSARVLQETLRNCQDRMGVARADQITFHDLRHTFASHFMMRGGDLFRLQRILGPEVFKEDYGRLVDVIPRSEPAQVLTMAGRGPAEADGDDASVVQKGGSKGVHKGAGRSGREPE